MSVLMLSFLASCLIIATTVFIVDMMTTATIVTINVAIVCTLVETIVAITCVIVVSFSPMFAVLWITRQSPVMSFELGFDILVMKGLPTFEISDLVC